MILMDVVSCSISETGNISAMFEHLENKQITVQAGHLLLRSTLCTCYNLWSCVLLIYTT